ncbi:MAG: DnaD domain protein [Bacilli bacterium]
MIKDALDFKYLLLDHYKKLKISEEEVITLLMIDHLKEQGNNFIVPNQLALKMSYKTKKIDEILTSLLEKGLITYIQKDDDTYTSIKPLMDKLYNQFKLDFVDEENSNIISKKNNDTNIYLKFEQLFSRPLSPVEVSQIQEWLSMGYSENLIIEALKEALSKNKKSFRSIDKILLSWQKRDDIENEGSSPINKDWDKNLDETIRIAKTPWIKDD